MENIKPNEVPEITQPDFLQEIEPPKREAKIIPLFEKNEATEKECDYCSGSGCRFCGFDQRK